MERKPDGQQQFDCRSAAVNKKSDLIDALPRSRPDHDGLCGSGVKRFLKLLAELAHDGDGCTCSPSNDELAEFLGVSRSTVKKRRERAKQLGYVDVEHSTHERNSYALQWPNIFEHAEIRPPISAPTGGRKRPPILRQRGPDFRSEGAGNGGRIRPPTCLMNECNEHGDFQSVSSDWLGNVERADLANPENVQAYYRAAVAAGFLHDDPTNRVKVFAAARYARRSKVRKPGAMFRSIIEKRQFSFATDAETDLAEQDIRGLDRAEQRASPIEVRFQSVGTSEPKATTDQQIVALAKRYGRPQ